MKSKAILAAMLAWALPLAVAPALAYDDSFTPGESAGAKITDKADAQVPLDLPLRDEAGNAVKLGDYFHPDRPVVLSMVYFNCTGLCNFTLNNLTNDLRKIELKPGTQFEIVTVSFDPADGPKMAAGKKENYIKSLGKPEVASSWHFLTSSDPTVGHTLGDAIGFGYRPNSNFAKNPEMGKFLHAAGIFICTPEGRVSRVQQGVSFDVDELRDSLIYASQGKISSGLFGVALSCGLFHFDAASGKYTWAALALMRVVGIGTLLSLVSGIGWMVYRDRKNEARLELNT